VEEKGDEKDEVKERMIPRQNETSHFLFL